MAISGLKNDDVAFRSHLLVRAFPALAPLAVAQAIRTFLGSGLTAPQLALAMRSGDPSAVFPALSALQMGQLLTAPALFGAIAQPDMRTALLYAGYTASDVDAALAQLFPPPVIVPPANPYFANTMTDPGPAPTWALFAGNAFTQSFAAARDGVPAELGVWMGNNQNPFSVTIHVAVNGTDRFTRSYNGCKQRMSDWAVVFPLDGFSGSVKAGDPMTFTVVPASDIRFAVITSARPGFPLAPFPRYGQARSKFYLR